MVKEKELKYNLLACSRRSEYCMAPIIPDDGYVFVASDISGAEPTIMLNYTDDPTLYNILYKMRGVKPYWENGILMTDSLYVTTMSKTILLRGKLNELGEDWLTLWYNDSSAAKEALGKKTYDLCKMLVLALLYGLQSKSLGGHLLKAGVVLTAAECSRIFEDFWNSIPELKALRDVLIYLFKQAKRAKRNWISPLGFPIPTGAPDKAFSFNIQSAVSVWVRHFNRKLFNNPNYKLVAVIHDEIVVMVRREQLKAYKADLTAAMDEVNTEFGFKYPLLLGFKVAENFYGFKG